VQAVVGALLVIPVSLILSLSSTGGSPLVYFVWAVGLGLAQLGLAVRFALCRDEQSARLLLRGTLLYLPAWLGMLLMVTM
jgi:heme O synthase-like polyprenyltransferase